MAVIVCKWHGGAEQSIHLQVGNGEHDYICAFCAEKVYNAYDAHLRTLIQNLKARAHAIEKQMHQP